MSVSDYFILAQTALSVLRCAYRQGTGLLVLQELSSTGLVDMALDHGHLAAILRLLPAELLGQALQDRGTFTLPRPADGWPIPVDTAGMLTRDLEETLPALFPTPSCVTAQTEARPSLGLDASAPEVSPSAEALQTDQCNDPRCGFCHPVMIPGLGAL